MGDLKELITNLSTFFDNQFDLIDSKTIERKRTVFSKHLYYTLIRMIQNKCSYESALIELKLLNVIDEECTHQALNTKILKGNYSKHFDGINLSIINEHFDQSSNKIRAVDGSKITMSRSQKKYGYQLVGKKRHCTGLLTTTYDVKNQIPLDYQISPDTGEIAMFHKQLIHMSSSLSSNKELYIFDRGYHSEKNCKHLLSLNKDFIIRVKENLTIIKDMKELNTSDYIIQMDDHIVRVIRYKLPSKYGKITKVNQKKFIIKRNDRNGTPLQYKEIIKNSNNKIKIIMKCPPKDYYLITSLVDSEKYPIDLLIDMYHQRWSIEEHYKTVKRNLPSNKFHFSTPESVQCELKSLQFISLMTRLFMKYLPQDPNKYKPNYTIISEKLVNHIIPMLIFKELYNLEKIIKKFKVFSSSKVKCKPGRHFLRKNENIPPGYFLCKGDSANSSIT